MRPAPGASSTAAATSGSDTACAIRAAGVSVLRASRISRRRSSATSLWLGAGFPKPNTDLTAVYEIAMFSRPGPTTAVTYEITNLVTNAVATGTVTTDLPTTTTLITPYSYMSVGGVSSVIGFSTMGLYIETDY